MSTHAVTYPLPTKVLRAQFTKRDLMLYALGIGCCSGNDTCHQDWHGDDREVRFVYEHHPAFEAFPTFLLALSFVAEEQPHSDAGHGSSQLGFGIRPFPPPSMSNYLEDGTNCGLLPKEFFRNEEDTWEAKDLPILHISQRLILHDKIKPSQITENAMDPPTSMQLNAQIISVKPRNIGTFVTSETTYLQHGRRIATSRMVALILGLDPELVVPLEAQKDEGRHSSSKKTKQVSQIPSSLSSTSSSKGKTVINYRVPKNAALLYRLSGDYNPLHVEDDPLRDRQGESQEVDLEKGAPVLHGLCTMGYAIRAVFRHVDTAGSNHVEFRLKTVECNFTKPVHVGDNLRVEVWDEEICQSWMENVLHVCFRVYREHGCSRCDETNTKKGCHSYLVVDKGRAQLVPVEKGLSHSTKANASRL